MDGEKPDLVAMGKRLAEALANHCMLPLWADLDDGERHSVLAVCEWMLMDWSLLERARIAHIKQGLRDPGEG